jgi:type I restriction enzyme S subunit
VTRYPAYPEYHETGIEWLGEIPSHWDAIKIKWLAKVRRGASPRPIDDPVYFDDEGEYSWVRISDVTASTKYLLETEQTLSELGKSKSVPMEPGEIFLSIAGSVGKPIITQIKCCIHDGFVYFVGLKENREYLFYLFSTDELYKGLGKMGTQLNLNTETIGDIKIPLPPRPEQRAIAAFLDERSARLDAAIAEYRRLADLLREQRAALISHTVTQGLDPDAPRKDSGIAWLGEIPAHWDTAALKYLVETKITDGPHETPEFVNDGIPFVSAEAVQNGQINFNSKRGYISPDLHHQYIKKLNPRRNDIFMVKSGATTGKLAIIDVDFEFSVWSPLALIRADLTIVTANFLFLALHADYAQKQVERTWSQGTQPNISMTAIERLQIIIPPLPEQRAIAAHLDEHTARIDAALAEIDAAIGHLEAYRAALIAAAVTGKIDVR